MGSRKVGGATSDDSEEVWEEVGAFAPRESDDEEGAGFESDNEEGAGFRMWERMNSG